ncbi:MAG TPA: TrmH family RNA methyltransferase [Candidatus Levybacteria bacterium]|nr:TrmH family RNA methyltransferase [Candidatus Levybacteria bacterium]
MQKLGAQQLREYIPTEEDVKKIKKNRQEIYIILDNVLDTYNVGAVFRLADAVGVKKVFLCAGTETPPNSRIKKASVSTWQWIDWEYLPTALDAVVKLREQNEKIKIVSVELDDNAIPYDEYDYSLPIALVVGHESDGVSREVLDASDVIVQLPQLGINKSLNVMVSLGIALYQVLEKNKINK